VCGASCAGDELVVLAIQAGALFALSLVLALPVTRALARARWPRRAPRAALVLWQAIGLAGGLGLLTAGVTLTAVGAGAHWRSAVLTAWRAWPHLGFWGWAGLVFTVCMAAWLVIVAVTSTARVVRARRGHRERLAMIARAGRLSEARDRDVLLVEHPVAAAYCLPGIRPQVVVTRGALTTLRAKELGAVLAHERAHARGHHHLVTQPFIAWARTFPFLSHAREGLEAVDVLVEMLADQLALRECEPQDLASALRRLNGIAPNASTTSDSGTTSKNGTTPGTGTASHAGTASTTDSPPTTRPPGTANALSSEGTSKGVDTTGAAGASRGAETSKGADTSSTGAAYPAAADLRLRTGVRLARLEGGTPPLARGAVAAVYLAAGLLVLGPPVLLVLS